MARVLVVDDEATLVATLRFNLEKEGYEVDSASDGPSALEQARANNPDLVILDLLLPGLSGLDVCRILRKESTVPIIILTAKGEEVDKVVGLELGADDYVTKPFGMQELMARVRRHLRRSVTTQSTQIEPVLEAGPLVVDLVRRQVTKDGLEIDLKPKEFELLAYFIRHREQVLSRNQLLEGVWGYEAFGQTRTVDVHVGRLREKIEDEPGRPTRIVTVRNIGYRFSA
jgi:DNA-binding response OmpR family regulator